METYKIFRHVLILLALASVTQAAFTYSFVNITANSATNAAIGEAQLSMQVSDFGSDQALFTFYNSGPLASSATRIYFEDSLGLLDGISSFQENTNFVDFDAFTSPGNLPGGNQPGVDFTEDFHAKATPQGEVLNGVSANGIGPSEQLGVIVDIENIGTFNDIISALDDTLIRVGMHVQSFPDGESEAFVNNGRTTTLIPTPGAFSLAMIGAAGLGYFRKRD